MRYLFYAENNILGALVLYKIYMSTYTTTTHNILGALVVNSTCCCYCAKYKQQQQQQQHQFLLLLITAMTTPTDNRIERQFEIIKSRLFNKIIIFVCQ